MSYCFAEVNKTAGPAFVTDIFDYVFLCVGKHVHSAGGIERGGAVDSAPPPGAVCAIREGLRRCVDFPYPLPEPEAHPQPET